MLYEPSTLASLTGLLATTLREEYDIDPAPLFSRAGLPLIPEGSPQQRYPLSTMRELYAFGYSWMASSTLLGAMQRLVRYYRLMSTASVVVELTELEDSYALSATFPEESKSPPKEGIDCGMTALLTLCDIVAEKEIRPIRIKLTCPASVHPDAYRQALRAPIEFDAPVGMFYFSKEVLLEPLPHGAADIARFYFSKEVLLEPLPHGAADIARATDKIAEHYIETLDPHKVASQVRQLLVALLPSGKTDQQLVSKRLNRSASSLQRQLAEEGHTYREVLDSTRRSLAEDYLADGGHSQAQIAYMLGFSDQSNFSRAFKRWTNMSPKEFRDSKNPD
jgi:AraC-like DNA-binding protein